MQSEMMYEMESLVDHLGALNFSVNFMSAGLGLLGYVLTSLALYTLAKRRGIAHAWLSWVPVASLWVLGSLADQYRYVAKGQVKSKRKILLTLSILVAVVSLLITVLGVNFLFTLIRALNLHYTDELIFHELGGRVLGLLFLALPVAGLSIALAVVRFMAVYDVYQSMEPENAALYLVLSILFHVTEPFFLFFNRDKDKGMPPRRQQQDNSYQQPQYDEPQYQQTVYDQPRDPEPWKDSEDHCL